MNFLTTKTYTARVTGICWDLTDEEYEAACEAEADCPVNTVIEVTTCVDPYEKWNEEGFSTGYGLFCDDVIEALTEKYGFCVESVFDVEVIEEVA